MAAKIRVSPVGEQMLLQLQLDAHVPTPVTLILDVVTRWNSQAFMFQRALQLQTYLLKLKVMHGVPVEVAESIPDRAVFRRVACYSEVLPPVAFAHSNATTRRWILY